jgi:hypothetical protein
VPSNAEICEVKAAELYRLAAETADPSIKETYFGLADEWADLSTHFKTVPGVDDCSSDDQSTRYDPAI